MNKKEQYFSKIAEYKERFRKLPMHILKGRLGSGFLYKEAAIAIRELIEEREKQEESICLIQSLTKLHGTCYFEILPGKYNSNCWNDNSVFMAEEVFGYLELVFERNEPEFGHYRFTEIKKEVWTSIINDFRSLIEALKEAQDIQALEGKVGFIFKDSMDRFASEFQSNSLALIEVLRELSQWLENQLQSNDYISVLGI
jgi:hypothetical protein